MQRLLLPCVFLALAAVLAFGAYLLWPHEAPEVTTYPEVAELSTHQDWSFKQFTDYFQSLAQNKGAPYAFGVLLRAPFPPDIDIHLIGHTVGYVLYDQQGIDGIRECTQDFRNACSHSVVISALIENGEAALNSITQACKQAPGGTGAYTMCFHGLGHGVLAYNSYDLEKAIAMCKKTGTPEYGGREYVECVGGTIMEMIDGVHDRAAWEQQVRRYFRDDDPLSPCDASFMPSEVRSICYDYLTPRLFTAAGDLHNPDTYAATFMLCDPLSGDDRDACYGGFGKEFVGIAEERDIRNIGSMSEENVRKVRGWCALAGDARGEEVCLSHALSSLFWGGENTPDAALTFCAIADPKEQGRCYAELSEQISYYLGGTQKGHSLCVQLPEIYQKGCKASSL